jgi:hypothetical protein
MQKEKIAFWGENVLLSCYLLSTKVGKMASLMMPF